MKSIPTCVILSLALLASCAPPSTDFMLYNEPHRLQYHFSPERNWMNDPNGMVFYDGEYHLFYQHNPYGDRWGHMSWGHAISTDLVHWEHRPVAIEEEDGIMIFSGSAVVDWRNTSGFGTDTEPPLVALYTGHTDTLQTQHIAYSIDRGRTWVKYASNPVLDIGLKDFRDPKVFWHEQSEQWVMVVALPTDRKVQFYGSPDLKQWSLMGDFGPAGSTEGIWECPDLFELPIEGEDGASRWVLIVNVGSDAAAGGSGGQYFVGTFDGATFVNDNADDAMLWLDHGADFYAAVTWSDIPATDGRRILLGWMNNWQYAQDIPTSPWRSAQSLPRTLSLRRTADGLRLAQHPVHELAALREAPRSFADLDFDAANGLDLDGRTLEIRAEIALNGARTVAVSVLGSGEEETVVGYDADAGDVFIDRSQSGAGDFHEAFLARHAAPLAAENDVVTLHIFVDHSSVEVFAGDGTAVLTDRVFTREMGGAVAFRHEGGAPTLVTLDVWSLASIWVTEPAL